MSGRVNSTAALRATGLNKCFETLDKRFPQAYIAGSIFFGLTGINNKSQGTTKSCLKKPLPQSS